MNKLKISNKSSTTLGGPFGTILYSKTTKVKMYYTLKQEFQMKAG